MKNILSMLFLSLQKRIDSILDENNEKVFRYVDHDFGFLDEDIPPLSYPAVLIDMNDTNWKNLGGHCQEGDHIVSLKIVFAPYSSTSNITPIDYVEKGLGFYEIETELNDKIHCWAPDYNVIVTPADPDADPPVAEVTKDLLADVTGSFTRLKSMTDKSRKDLHIRKVFYGISIEDYGTRSDKNRIKVPFTPNITEEIIDPGEIIDL